MRNNFDHHLTSSVKVLKHYLWEPLLHNMHITILTSVNSWSPLRLVDSSFYSFPRRVLQGAWHSVEKEWCPTRFFRSYAAPCLTCQGSSVVTSHRFVPEFLSFLWIPQWPLTLHAALRLPHSPVLRSPGMISGSLVHSPRPHRLHYSTPCLPTPPQMDSDRIVVEWVPRCCGYFLGWVRH